jgi:hypothetical protein
MQMPMSVAVGVAILCAMPAIAQTAVLPEGMYRGGNNLVGHGCQLGDDPCMVGLVMDFAQNSQGQTTVTFYSEASKATFNALKDGNPYSNESKMKKVGTFPIKVASDGTFGFNYNVFVYDKCRTPAPSQLQCYFHKTEGVSSNWVTLFKK